MIKLDKYDRQGKTGLALVGVLGSADAEDDDASCEVWPSLDKILHYMLILFEYCTEIEEEPSII
jgi:hypothetical protein